MMRGIYIFCLLFWSSMHLHAATTPKTVMLVLGSADSLVLQNRILVAHRLYKTQHIDKIIVSGGCGAHSSSICEARMMQQGLVKMGVQASKIYKEENAKSTVQNYVFSRILKDEYGHQIIHPGDSVFVVSDHWHAIAVAARFSKYDQVYAQFYIEGAIAPKASDKLDYVSIFNGEEDQSLFLRKALWLTPDMAWIDQGHTFYLMDTLVYQVESATGKLLSSSPRSTFFADSRLRSTDQPWSCIDAGDYWYIKADADLFMVDKKSRKVLKTLLWADFVLQMPLSWKHKSFQTGFILEGQMYLFAADAVLHAQKKGAAFLFQQEGQAIDFIPDWPFSWGLSNVAGLMVDTPRKTISLFRNREFMLMDFQFNAIQKPKNLTVKWVDNL